MRKPFVAGNWKMNTDSHSSAELVKAVAADSLALAGSSVDVAVFPPFVYLQAVAGAISSSSIAVGAQDIYFEQKGAFTGEISTSMLKDIGCAYALCGHSERRHVIGEQDELVNKKVTATISGGLLPILCVGELLEEREANKTVEVVTRQVKKGLAPQVSASSLAEKRPSSRVVLASALCQRAISSADFGPGSGPETFAILSAMVPPSLWP